MFPAIALDIAFATVSVKLGIATKSSNRAVIDSSVHLIISNLRLWADTRAPVVSDDALALELIFESPDPEVDTWILWLG